MERRNEMDIMGGGPFFHRLRINRAGDRDPGSLRLHGGDFRVLEASDASEHDQNTGMLRFLWMSLQ
jgi:hypothetical protein